MASNYHEYVVTGITSTAARDAIQAYKDVNQAGTEISGIEYNATTSTLTVSIGGTLTGGVVGRVRSFLVTRFGGANVTDVSRDSNGARVRTGSDHRGN